MLEAGRKYLKMSMKGRKIRNIISDFTISMSEGDTEKGFQTVEKQHFLQRIL